METHLLTREDKKYSDLWQNGYCDANWKRLAEVVVERASPNQRNIIDFGFGSANSMQFFRDNSFYAEGVEISTYVVGLASHKGFRAYHASIDDIKGLQGTFAIGFCYNFLQKLPEDCIPRVLEEMTKLCHWRLYVGISQEESVVKPEAWLERHLLRAFGDDQKWNVKRLDLEWSLGYEISKKPEEKESGSAS